MAKKKHAGGRPTIYSEEVLEKTQKYLEETNDEYLAIKGKGGRVVNHKLVVHLPSIEGLARYLQVHRDTIYSWKGQYPKFSYILGQILTEQAKRLLENGLSGNYNSNIVKLALGKHGYKEQQEVEHSGELLLPLTNALKDISKKK